MTYDEFMLKHIKRGRSVANTINGWPYMWFMELASLTEHIDFNCGFNERGICKKFRDYGGKQDAMCCCHSCATQNGYLYILPANCSIQNRYVEMYDDKTGYWRKGKGCILPRRMRSQTCLTYSCGMVKSMRKPAYALFDLIRKNPGRVKIQRRTRVKPDTIVHAMRDWLIKEREKLPS